MRHPLAARRHVFLPLLVSTLGLTAVLGRVDRQLRTGEAPWGIVSFEVAGDAATAGRMLGSWDETARSYAAFSLGFDYLYLVVYSTTIALGCLWAAGVLAGVAPGLASLGVPLAWGQWLAALLDAVENWALAAMVFGAAAEPWPGVAWWCAVPKFVLVAAGILYTLAGVAARALRPAGAR
jgi:hypothetical protein